MSKPLQSLRRRFDPTQYILPILIGLAGLLLYGLTTAPSIVELFDDSLEFQLVLPTLSIPHPTGYPLYALLGGLWSRILLPFGTWAWRVNILSALSGAVALIFLYGVGRKLTGSRTSALVAVVAFALGPVWWSQTTIAEVYALHNLILLATLWAALGAPPTDRVQAERRLLWFGLLAGLGLAHHRTALLGLFWILIYQLWQIYVQAGVRPRLTKPILISLAPLLLYLYLPIRAASGAADLEGAYQNSWDGFWRHVLALDYGAFFAANPLAVSRQAGHWLNLFVAQMGWPALLLAMAGAVLSFLRPRRRGEWILLLAIWMTNLLFVLNYQVGDAEVFAIPLFWIGALWGANGADHLTQRARASLRPYLTGAIILLVMTGVPGRGPFVDRSQEWTVHNYAVAMAKVDFPSGSRVVGLRGQITALEYMQRAEGLGKNATGVAIDDPLARRQFVIRAMEEETPLYLTQELEGIAELFSFSGEGPLIRVWPRGEARIEPPENPLNYRFEGTPISLVGYARHVLDQPGEPRQRLVLYWLPREPISRTLKVSFRLSDERGELLATQDHFPLHQVALTPSWVVDGVVRDSYELPLPPQAHRLLVIVYDAQTLEEAGRFEIPL